MQTQLANVLEPKLVALRPVKTQQLNEAVLGNAQTLLN